MTVAKPVNGGYVLNGRKCFISDGAIADKTTLFARLDGEGLESWTCFLIEKGMAGFSIGRREHKMGQRVADASELILTVKRIWGRGWSLTIYILSALFLISIIRPVSAFITPCKSAYPVSQAIKSLLPANQELYQYKIFLYGIATYNEIRTPVVEDFNEMSFGMKQLPPVERAHYLLTSERLMDRCKQKGVIYCLTEYKDRLEKLKVMFPHLEVIWSNGWFYLLKLHYGI